MKNLILSLPLVLIVIDAYGQKVIEKNLNYQGQHITLEVKFASKIEVITWDKPSVFIKADIQTDKGKHIDLYELNIDQSQEEISIVSEAEPVFKAFHKENKETGGKRYYYTDDMYDFNYVLYVPKNAKLLVHSINGSLYSKEITGEFKADLINGNIEIEKYSGQLELSTINGEIDLKVSEVDFVAETVHGDIYADKALDLLEFERQVGQRVASATDYSATKLSLNTVNGNMYLRR